MKTYCATFKADSSLTGLPSAQTIFGALCQIIVDAKGQEALQDYLDSFDHSPVLIHSAMYPADLFPMPKQNIFPLTFVNEAVHAASSESRLAAMAEYKKYKNIRFVSQKILETYVLPCKFEQLRKDLLYQPQQFQLLDNGILRCSGETSDYEQRTVLQTRNGQKGLMTEKDLFYQTQIYPSKNQKFSIYLKSEWPAEELEDLLSQFEIFGIGTRRTVGCNVFTLLSVREIRLKSGGPYHYLLSDCIPEDEVNLTESFYSLKSALYRASKSYTGGFITGRYTYLEAGSLIKAPIQKRWLGKNHKSESRGKPVWHYGMGFVF